MPEFLTTAVAGAFSVTAAGADLQVASLVAFGGSPVRSLVISLQSPAVIYQNQTVKLSYDKTAAGTDALEDAAGNEVATFTDFVVTNNSIVERPTVSNATISIADASAAENAGHLLFEVTLSRALRNTVKVDFETISGGTATEGEDYHARRTYTHVILAGDRTAQMGFALIEDTVSEVDETVKARLSNAREVDAYGNVVKLLNITTAEATGTITAPPTTTTPVPGLTIRIRDATGDEDDGYLDFRVRLSRKYDDLRVLRLRDHLGRHRRGRNGLPQVPESHVLDADRKTGGQALRPPHRRLGERQRRDREGQDQQCTRVQ